MVTGLRLIAFIGLSVTALACPGKGTIWLDIDTGSATLKVMDGNVPKVFFENIAIGRYGTTRDKYQGDNKTPLGRFTIAWVKESTRYHLFFGLDYPTLEYAYQGYRQGRISEDAWEEIREAFAARRPPPQSTPLGGAIGIHGIGEGDLRFHKFFNWTNGCVALTNDQIESLKEWVSIGTPVTIH